MNGGEIISGSWSCLTVRNVDRRERRSIEHSADSNEQRARIDAEG